MMGTLLTLYKKWHGECERGKEQELGSREEPSDGRERLLLGEVHAGQAG